MKLVQHRKIMLVQQYETKMHRVQIICTVPSPFIHYIMNWYPVKHAIQFRPVFPRDATSCLLMPTVCFSCLLAKPFDTSVDGPAVHKTAERHISARFPQGVTEGSVSADPCSSVSGSRRQWNLLPVKVKLRDNKIKSCITNWIIVVDNWRF